MQKRLNEIFTQDTITGYWHCPLTGEVYSDREIEEYQSKIELYSADIQKYQSDLAEKTQESTVSTQNVQYYEKQSDKYYNWALGEVQQYIQNNSKMINKTIAAQAAQQQRK